MVLNQDSPPLPHRTLQMSEDIFTATIATWGGRQHLGGRSQRY